MDYGDRHVIEWLSFEGGFLAGQRFEFHAGLNTNIGGQGAGKSTSVEAARFCLGIAPSRRSAEQAQRIIEDNVADGTVSMGIRTADGVRYTVSRRREQPPVVHDAEGNIVYISLDKPVFGLEMYSQGEIPAIALDTSSQLPLIDHFIEVEVARLNERIDEIRARLLQKGKEIDRIDGEISTALHGASDLPSVEEALRGSELAADGTEDEAKAVLAGESRRIRERRALSAWLDEVSNARGAVDAFARGAVSARGAGALDPETLSGERAAIFARLDADQRELRTALDVAVSTLKAAVERADVGSRAIAKELDVHLAAEEIAFASWAERRKADKDRLVRRSELERRLVAMQALLRRAAELKVERGVLEEERRRLRRDLHDARKKRSSLRNGVANDIKERLGDDFCVTIVEGGNAATYRELLASILVGANIRSQSLIDGIKTFLPDELVEIVESNKVERIMKLDDSKGGHLERAQRIINHVKKSGRLYEVDAAEMDDEAVIQIRVGPKLRPITNVSGGQRCVSILSIVLVGGSSPLIVDQPEQDIDAPNIMSILIRAIERAKERRQIIFNTKEPNIVMNGKADRLHVVVYDEPCGVIAARGPRGEVLGPAEDFLEGGRAALMARVAQYEKKKP